MTAMNKLNRTVEPAHGSIRRFYNAKYQVFLAMHEDQLSYRGMMARTMGS
jgi:hypothetical protein